jgi:hypothetical protein
MFEQDVIGIVNSLRGALGLDESWGEGEVVSHNRLHALTLDTYPFLSDTKLPKMFPIVFLQRTTLINADLDDLQYLLKESPLAGRIGIHCEHALLIVFCDESEIMQAKRLLDEELRTVYGIDTIVLGREDLERIIIADNPRAQSRQTILAEVDLAKISPFVIAGPVPERMFYGREREIRTVVQRIRAGSIAIVGGRRIGKTSILQKAARVLSQPSSSHHPLYINCHFIGNHEEFFENVEITCGLPTTVAHTPVGFRQLVLHLAEASGGKYMVFMLDEIDNLLSYDVTERDEKLIKAFRSLSEEGVCHFVFSGSKVLNAQLHDADSPLFNFCNVLPLGYLDEKSAGKLLTEPMASINLKLQESEKLVQETIRISSGHPRVIQYIGDELVRLVSKEVPRQVTIEHLCAVTDSNRFRQDFIETIWGQSSPLEKLITLVMLEKDDGFSIDDLRRALSTVGVSVSNASLSKALSNLEIYPLLHRQGNFYHFVPKEFPHIVEQSKDIAEEIRELKADLRNV